MNQPTRAESVWILLYLNLTHRKEADLMGKWLLTLFSCAVVIIREITKDNDDSA